MRKKKASAPLFKMVSRDETKEIGVAAATVYVMARNTDERVRKVGRHMVALLNALDEALISDLEGGGLAVETPPLRSKARTATNHPKSERL